MSDRPTPTGLDERLTALLKSSAGTYEIRLLAGEARDEMRELKRQRDAAVEALKAARKTLSYCAANPRELHPMNNAQYIVASNALYELDAVLREIEGES